MPSTRGTGVTASRMPSATGFLPVRCQACFTTCPKKIKIPGKAIEKLRALANTRGFTLPRHLEVAALIKETGRSVPRTATSFLEQVPDVIEPYVPVKATVGFFVGCMYNLRQQQSALDAMEVLRRNGIRVIIPKEQICCGSLLIRTGQLDYVESLKRRNIQTFTSRGIDTVLTMCAGCGSTLKNDYTTPFKVIDINELLTQYGIEPPAKLGIRATYHDPCHLLRGQGVRDQPRELHPECRGPHGNAGDLLRQWRGCPPVSRRRRQCSASAGARRSKRPGQISSSPHVRSANSISPATRTSR